MSVLLDSSSSSFQKGPWKVKEDEVLLKHVSKCGPRDWSSLLSKCLLRRRSGKSCRLRWVNKLRPDLKSGCKFSAEEERTVIELQSHLLARQKRLSRLLLRPNRRITRPFPTSSLHLWRCYLEAIPCLVCFQSWFSLLRWGNRHHHPIQVGCSAWVDPSNTNNSIATQVTSSLGLIPSDPQKSTDLEHHKVSFPESQSEFELLSAEAQEELIRTLDLDYIQCDALFHRDCDLPSDILDQIKPLPSPHSGW